MNIRKFFATFAAITVGLTTALPAGLAFDDVSERNPFFGYIDYLAENGVISTNNDNFRPRDQISRFEAAKVVAGAASLDTDTSCDHEFDDVDEDNVFYDYVKTLVCNKIISARDDFNGEQSITRAEFTKIAVNAFGVPEDITEGPSFNDVDADNPFYEFIESARAEGLIKGYANGDFGPNNPILRQEVAKIAANAHGYVDLSDDAAAVQGEAAGIILEVSAEEVTVGSPAIITATIVNDEGETVDYDEEVNFITDFGTLSDTTVTAKNGIAVVRLTTAFGGKATVTASAEELSFANAANGGEITISFVVPDGRRFQVYSAVEVGQPSESVMLYMTVLDNEGVPVEGLSNDLSYLQDGKGFLTSIEPVSTATGVYSAEYTLPNLAGTEVVTFQYIDGDVTEEASVAVQVSEPQITIRSLQDNCSINSTCGLLVEIRDSSGRPVENGISDNTLQFISSNETYATVDQDNAVHLGGGVYYAELETFNQARPVDITVRLTAANTVNEFVRFEIADYVINARTYGNTINTINGTSVVAVSVEDINGQPVTSIRNGGTLEAFDPATDLEFEVRSDVAFMSPSTDTDFADDNDWLQAGSVTVIGNATAQGTLTLIDQLGSDPVTVNVAENDNANTVASNIATAANSLAGITAATTTNVVGITAGYLIVQGNIQGLDIFQPQGVYLTEITANNSRRDGPVRIEAQYQNAVNSDTSVSTATIQAIHPTINEVRYFEGGIIGAVTLGSTPQNGTFTLDGVSIDVETGQTLETVAANIAAATYPNLYVRADAARISLHSRARSSASPANSIAFDVDTTNITLADLPTTFDGGTQNTTVNANNVVLTALRNQFLISVEDASSIAVENLAGQFRLQGQTTNIPAGQTVELAGGLYVVRGALEDASSVSIVATNNQPIVTSQISRELNSSSNIRDIAAFGIDKIVESLGGEAPTTVVSNGGDNATITLGTQARSAFALGQVAPRLGVLLPATFTGANTDPAVNQVTATVDGTGAGIVDANTAVTYDFFQVGVIDAEANIEETESSILTLSTDTSTDNTVRSFSIESTGVAVDQVDHVNNIATERRQSFVIPYIDGERIYPYSVITDDGTAGTDRDTIIIEESENAAEFNLDSDEDVVYNLSENGSIAAQNLHFFTWIREDGEDEIGSGYVNFQIDEDDEEQNLGRMVFRVENPQFHVFSSENRIIVSGDEDLRAADLEDQIAVVDQSYIFTIAFDDNGVAVDLTSIDAGDGIIVVELEGENAEVYAPDNPIDGTFARSEIDDEIQLVQSVTIRADEQGNTREINVPGVYRAVLAAEDDAGSVVVTVAPQFDDNRTHDIDVEIVYPTVDLTIFPGGIDLSKSFGQLYVMAVVKDQYGRSVDGLTQNEDQLLFEIAGDDHSYDVYPPDSGRDDLIGALYIADYRQDDTGEIPVEIRYNDDTTLAEGSFFVVEQVDIQNNPNTFNSDYNFNYDFNFAVNNS